MSNQDTSQQQYEDLSQRIRMVYGSAANHVVITSQVTRTSSRQGFGVRDHHGEVLSPAPDALCAALAEEAFALLGSGCTLLAHPTQPGRCADAPAYPQHTVALAERIEDLPWSHL